LGIDAIQVLDPTLLLPAEHYIRLAGEFSEKPSVMSYILDRTPERTAAVERVCRTLDLPENDVTAPCRMARGTNIDDCVWPPIERWLAGLAAARFVVTDSFHGTALAILFNKPFVALTNHERGAARFESLLSLFGLQDRLLSPDTPLPDGLITEIPDFERVNTILARERENSLAFLKSIIK
jgi:hypothetical protein